MIVPFTSGYVGQIQQDRGRIGERGRGIGDEGEDWGTIKSEKQWDAQLLLFLASLFLGMYRYGPICSERSCIDLRRPNEAWHGPNLWCTLGYLAIHGLADTVPFISRRVRGEVKFRCN
jgi:hypothetical protein